MEALQKALPPSSALIFVFTSSPTASVFSPSIFVFQSNDIAIVKVIFSTIQWPSQLASWPSRILDPDPGARRK